MASTPQLSPRKNTPQLAESPIINPAQAEQGNQDQNPTEDLMVLDNITATNNRPEDSRAEVRTPEPHSGQHRANTHTSTSNPGAEGSPISPGQIPSFDWDEFEALYEKALSEANNQERELLHEFDSLVKYFNVWASAASAHDNERALKRLQTRERYVKIAEQSLAQKKQHLTEVVRAFQSALALLSQH